MPQSVPNLVLVQTTAVAVPILVYQMQRKDASAQALELARQAAGHITAQFGTALDRAARQKVRAECAVPAQGVQLSRNPPANSHSIGDERQTSTL